MTSTDRHKQRRAFAVDHTPGGFLFRHGQIAEISRAADAALARRGLSKKYNPYEGMYRHKKMSKSHVYRGVLGEVLCDGRDFVAWQDGFRIGTYSTLEEAMESLAWREKPKPN
jgi:hypothetical protein